MSFNFAVKDLAHFSDQTKSSIKASTAVVAVSVIFLNLIQSLGLLTMPEDIQNGTSTLYEIFTQFNSFLIALVMLLAIIIILSKNHSIVQSRKNDINIMKAVGTYPRQLYSFYLTEILLITILSFGLGLAIGYIFYVFIFLLIQGYFVGSVWNPNYIVIILFFFAIILTTYLINGMEIRKIGNKSYNDSKTGNIQENINAKLSPTWKRFLKKKSINIKLAIKNLMRKKYMVKEYLLMISVAIMVLLTSIIGVITIASSGISYVDQAQGNEIIGISANPIMNSFERNYLRFSEENIIYDDNYDYLQSEYNLTDFKLILSNYLSSYGIELVEPRIYTVQLFFEEKGFVLVEYVNEDGNETIKEFQEVGTGTNITVVPIQGVNFQESVQNRISYVSEEPESIKTMIGDTLAANNFENAYLQKFSFKNNNRTYVHDIDAVSIDPFNNGNSIYIDLETFQNNLNRINYVNLILFDYANVDEGHYDEFIDGINALIRDNLGEDFKLKDLKNIFSNNIQYLILIEIIPFAISIIMALLIVFILFQYQKGRVKEDEKDHAIIRALGGIKKNIFTVTIIEQSLIILLGFILAFIGTLFIVLFLLLERSQIPSIAYPIGISAMIFVIIEFITYKTTHKSLENYYKSLENVDL